MTTESPKPSDEAKAGALLPPAPVSAIDVAHQWLKKNFQEWNGPINTWTPEQVDNYCRDLGLLVDFATDCWPNEKRSAMSLPKICTCPTVPDADCPFHHQEADRNYDLGRKHAEEEMHPAIMALEALYTASGYLRLRCEQICPEVKRFSDWKKHSEAMQMAENARKSASEKGQRCRLTDKQISNLIEDIRKIHSPTLTVVACIDLLARL